MYVGVFNEEYSLAKALTELYPQTKPWLQSYRIFEWLDQIYLRLGSCISRFHILPTCADENQKFETAPTTCQDIFTPSPT